MKMKNILISGMSLALVACITIGGTLAYLSDQDGTLTNTFRFAGITVDVTEISNDKTADTNLTVGAGKTEGGINYTNLVPGQPINKQVDVKVTSDVKVELYMLVDFGTGANALTMVEGKDPVSKYGWTEVSINEQGKKLYTRTVEATAEDKDFDLFDEVKVPDINVTAGSEVTLNNIVINTYAVQSEHIAAGTTSNKLAAEALNVTLK